MGRITSTFKRLGKVNEVALIPRITVGYPSLEITRQLVPIMARQGADLIELTLPLPADQPHQLPTHSRLPTPDSPTIADSLTITAEARRANEIPLLFTSPYSPIYKYGLAKLATDCATSGVDGLIVPDATPEQAADLKPVCQSAGIDLIFLITPAHTDEHLSRLAETASGFIYCILPTEITNARSELESFFPSLVERVRQFTDLPIVLDFGLTTPQQVAQITQYADGAVVAEALVSVMNSLPEDEVILGIADLVRELKEATVKGT